MVRLFRTASRLSRRASCIAVAALLAAAPTFALATATWLAPVSGTWSNPANWSTNPAAPNDPTAEVFVSATGAPYAITVNSPIALESFTNTSPDATLKLSYVSTLALSGRLDFGPGTLSLQAGTIIGGTLAG